MVDRTKKETGAIAEGAEAAKRIAGMKVAKRLAVEYATNYPQIAQLFVEGATLDEIGRRIGVYGDDPEVNKVRKSALSYALNELIPEEDRKTITDAHYKEHARIVFGEFTEKQRSEFGKRGGRVTKDQGLGIFAMTEEERRQAIKKGQESLNRRGTRFWNFTGEQQQLAHKRSAEARGFRIAPDEEVDFILDLSKNPDYRHHSGLRKGHPDIKKIEAVYKGKFGVIPKPTTVKYLLERGRLGEKRNSNS